ncbi:hypothetical protein [Litchfieldia salsa]|uniref:Uncharacterized protein n=1 Tax=Litchfieldia salsa TaxID=930152 RepID=A0A1H0WYD7_9BACI|nr:hypothetical protein [Litchfieldia salsa]SDP95748.1 hypothetical protein SAMN05216565_11939 [Litchfieldia salsa]
MRYAFLYANQLADQLMLTVTDFVLNKTITFTIDELQKNNLSESLKTFILTNPDMMKFF